MRAAQISDYDGPEGLRLTDQASKPEPATGEVLVAVQAAGVNPFDIKVSEGTVRQMKELTFPATLGGDVSGTVAAVGDGVTEFEVGQAVYGQAGALSGQGSFAEFTSLKTGSLALKPESVDFLTAAALPLVTSSALQALDFMQLQAGQTILIHGGAGGIGGAAIQLAKHAGTQVITTASAADTDYVKSLGADEVIDYTTQDFASAVSDIDAVFDTVGGDTNQRSYSVLRDGGAFVSMVSAADAELVTARNIRYEHQFTQVSTAGLNRISQLVDSGALKINVDKVFPLEQASEALQHLKAGHPKGKVVIQVSY